MDEENLYGSVADIITRLRTADDPLNAEAADQLAYMQYLLQRRGEELVTAKECIGTLEERLAFIAAGGDP